ncbi:MAG: hypothetical protein ACRC1W_16880 [Shewanella sp.]
MKLTNIDPAEITVIAVYVLTCYMCDKQLHLATEDCSVGDVAFSAATQGWHSYQTADESCSIACPSCIKEVQENEAED